MPSPLFLSFHLLVILTILGALARFPRTNLPGLAETVDARNAGPIRRLEIVFGVVIVVAAEATHSSFVPFGQGHFGVAIAVPDDLQIFANSHQDVVLSVQRYREYALFDFKMRQFQRLTIQANFLK